jgi:hypothetical protein
MRLHLLHRRRLLPRVPRLLRSRLGTHEYDAHEQQGRERYYY